jgi:hypothetical protein
MFLRSDYLPKNMQEIRSCRSAADAYITTTVKSLPVNLPDDFSLGSNGVANPVTVVHCT